MTLEMTCQHCGQSRAYEYAAGDRSGLCSRPECLDSRRKQRDRILRMQAPLVWWIDTFRIRPADFYKYAIHGFNTGTDSEMYWQIPALKGPYAFRLREVR